MKIQFQDSFHRERNMAIWHRNQQSENVFFNSEQRKVNRAVNVKVNIEINISMCKKK